MNIYFAQNIRVLRKQKKLTMQEFAKKMHVTKSRVNMWENGGTIPRLPLLIKLARFFRVSIDALLLKPITNKTME